MSGKARERQVNKETKYKHMGQKTCRKRASPPQGGLRFFSNFSENNYFFPKLLIYLELEMFFLPKKNCSDEIGSLEKKLWLFKVKKKICFFFDALVSKFRL